MARTIGIGYQDFEELIRVSKESIFSDLNNLEVVTTTSRKYMDSFGFTEEEVFCALKEYQLSDKKEEVKAWYDGFTFGTMGDIYNPWSVLNFLDSRSFGTYWANTSSNSLIGRLLQRESGFGRCDVILEPKKAGLDAIIIEFKVRSPGDEGPLEDTVQAALRQISEKQYEAGLRSRGIEKERIRALGFAFEGKTVLIGG